MNFLKFIFSSFVVIGILILGLIVAFELSTPKRSPSDTITILRGQNALQIANDLKAQGYIKSKTAFLLQVIKNGDFRALKAGKYDLKGLSQSQIIDKLVNLKTVPSLFTVTPGQTLRDISQTVQSLKISSAADFITAAYPFKAYGEYDFLDGLPQNASLEGYLYPDTYQLSEDPNEKEMILIMLKNFGQKLTGDLRAEIARQNKTIFQILTMASMLEKEVKSYEDKTIVAGILWKRLDQSMRLQVDSTLLYYAAAANSIDKNIDSPYNTYKYFGLPAGPICNPGIDSIKAAIYPIDTPYLFYLSAKDGTTIFSKNYGEHLINKAKYLDN